MDHFESGGKRGGAWGTGKPGPHVRGNVGNIGSNYAAPASSSSGMPTQASSLLPSMSPLRSSGSRDFRTLRISREELLGAFAPSLLPAYMEPPIEGVTTRDSLNPTTWGGVNWEKAWTNAQPTATTPAAGAEGGERAAVHTGPGHHREHRGERGGPFREHFGHHPAQSAHAHGGHRERYDRDRDAETFGADAVEEREGAGRYAGGGERYGGRGDGEFRERREEGGRFGGYRGERGADREPGTRFGPPGFGRGQAFAGLTRSTSAGDPASSGPHYGNGTRGPPPGVLAGGFARPPPGTALQRSLSSGSAIEEKSGPQQHGDDEGGVVRDRSGWLGSGPPARKWNQSRLGASARETGIAPSLHADEAEVPPPAASPPAHSRFGATGSAADTADNWRSGNAGQTGVGMAYKKAPNAAGARREGEMPLDAEGTWEMFTSQTFAFEKEHEAARRPAAAAAANTNVSAPPPEPVAPAPEQPQQQQQREDVVRAPPQEEDAAKRQDEEVQWYYMDPTHTVQGPFASSDMREWFMSGYFSDDLPVRCGKTATFTPLLQLLTEGVSANGRPIIDQATTAAALSAGGSEGVRALAAETAFTAPVYPKSVAPAKPVEPSPAPLAPQPAAPATSTSQGFYSALGLGAPGPVVQVPFGGTQAGLPQLSSLSLGATGASEHSAPTLGLSGGAPAPFAGASNVDSSALYAKLSSGQALQQQLTSHLASAHAEYKGQVDMFTKAMSQLQGLERDIQELQGLEMNMRQRAVQCQQAMQQVQAAMQSNASNPSLMVQMSHLQTEGQRISAAMQQVAANLTTKVQMHGQLKASMSVMQQRISANQQRIIHAEAAARGHASQLHALAQHFQSEMSNAQPPATAATAQATVTSGHDLGSDSAFRDARVAAGLLGQPPAADPLGGGLLSHSAPLTAVSAQATTHSTVSSLGALGGPSTDLFGGQPLHAATQAPLPQKQAPAPAPVPAPAPAPLPAADKPVTAQQPAAKPASVSVSEEYTGSASLPVLKPVSVPSSLPLTAGAASSVAAGSTKPASNPWNVGVVSAPIATSGDLTSVMRQQAADAEKSERERPRVVAQVHATSAAAGNKPAWTTTNAPGKSLKEIQAEEEAARIAKERTTAGSTSAPVAAASRGRTMADIVAGGSVHVNAPTAWSSKAAATAKGGETDVWGPPLGKR